MPWYEKPDRLDIAHPALVGHPVTLGITGHWELSYEMAEFLTTYRQGGYEYDNPSHIRCYSILLRRSCYAQQIVTPFTYYTNDGKNLCRDAEVILRRLKAYYESINQHPPLWSEVTQLDEIVLYGSIPTSGVMLLEKMYEKIPPEKRKFHKFHKYPAIPSIPPLAMYHYNGDDYLLASSTRGNRGFRLTVENLVKFGLLEHINLPRWAAQRGHGRSPVGSRMTVMGLRFIESFLQHSDPMLMDVTEALIPEVPVGRDQDVQKFYDDLDVESLVSPENRGMFEWNEEDKPPPKQAQD